MMRSGSGRRTSATIWRASFQASALDMPEWIIGTSASCAPIFIAGFRLAIGS
jgi:hypothetical protein